MQAVKRVVSTSFWTDDKVVDSFTPEDKYFMLYLLTNPHTKQIGIYPLNIKVAAFETGYSPESVSHLLYRFENVHKIIKRSETTSEIAIKNFLRYSIVKGGKPVLDCLNAELSTIKDLSLLSYVIDSIDGKNDLTDTVSAFILYIKKNSLYLNNINEDDNENDNDNDSTVPVRAPYGERTAEKEQKPKRKYTRKPFVPPTLQEIEEYCKSRNSCVDPKRFYDYFSTPDDEGRTWIDSKGNPVRNWKQKIIVWEGSNQSQKKTNYQEQPRRKSFIEIAEEMDREDGVL